MFEQATLRNGLPLLQPAQAQKHVTVNDALMRIDGMLNLVLQSTTVATPPSVAPDGHCWAVPAGAAGAWAGQGGSIAIGAAGGWIFATPYRGQRAFATDLGAPAIWDGSRWSEGALTLGRMGAGLNAGVTEGEVEIVAGAAMWAGVFIPANSMVLGVTARVTQRLTGTLTSWAIGVSGSGSRFGSGLGLELNSWSQGLLSAPISYYAETNLRLAATGGNFETGRVKLAIHWLSLGLPDPA